MKRSRTLSHDTLAGFTFNPKLSSLPCDHYHHFYHYRASLHYLWLAETLRALGLKEEMMKAYDKAIFQDHLNDEAMDAKQDMDREARAPAYDMHPASDAEFRKTVGLPDSAATSLHDQAVAADDTAKAHALLDQALIADACHSSSWFARGRLYFLEQKYDRAKSAFEEAIRLAHADHEAYHQSASAAHLARARDFMAEGELDLAITDCTKALDLNQKNKEALLIRAEAYRAKDSVRLAESDETDAAKL